MQTFTEPEVTILKQQYTLMKEIRIFMSYAYVGTQSSALVEQKLMRKIEHSLAAAQEVLI